MENKPFDKRDYPIKILKEAEQLFNFIKADVEENQEILKITQEHPLDILVQETSRKSEFRFNIKHIEIEDTIIGSPIMFNYVLMPQNSIYTESQARREKIKDTLEDYKQWRSIIRDYHNVNLTPDQAILLEYEEEFYTHFEIVDEDSDTKPFDLPNQLLIDALYEKTIEVLEQNSEENKELIEEAKEIKRDIPNMTKKSTVRKTSKFLAKLRKQGLSLFKSVLKEIKGELIKRGVGSFLDNLPDWWTNLLG